MHFSQRGFKSWYFRPWLASMVMAILSSLGTIPVCSAQNLRFDHLSVKQGLSQANVVDLMQDKFGFIWIATEDGLNLYDGYKLTVFRNNPKDEASISSNYISCLSQDELGNLWIGTSKGLNYYDRRLNQFVHFFSDPDDVLSLAGNSVTAIHIDPTKQLWVGAAGALHLYNPDTKKFKRWIHANNHPGSLLNGSVESIITDRQNHLWIAVNNGGISMMNADKNTFTNYVHDPNNPSGGLNDNEVKYLHEDAQGKIWIATSAGGLNQLDVSKNTFKHFEHDATDPKSLASQLLRSVTSDKQGRIWVSTDEGINVTTSTEGKFDRIFNNPADPMSVSSNITVKIIFDNDGRMWVGTRNGGVNIYDEGRYLFEHYKHNAQDDYSLSNNNSTAISEDLKGNLWIGTDGGGVNYFDRKTGRFTSLRHDPRNTNSISIDKVLAVESANDGTLWLGMWDGGLNHYNPITSRVTRYMPEPGNPNSLSDTRIFRLYEDKEGSMWVGAFQNGLNKYNPETDDFTVYRNQPDQLNSITAGTISDMAEDHLGNLWIATTAGLDMMDRKTNTFTHYKTGIDSSSISSNGILSLLFDKKKRLWIGTDAGLNLFDYDSKTFKVYKEGDGLPNEVVIGILEDSENNLWLSTNKGLTRFNPDSMTFKVYDDSYGLQDNQFGKWSYAALSSGELAFGGANGFNVFDPRKIKDNPNKPAVILTDFKLFNKSVPIGENEILHQSIMYTTEMSLSYAQNFFTFEFTALNYRQTEKNQYKYILEGFDREWVDAGTERKAAYTNISPGEYVFKVIASNNDGVWNTEGVAVKVVVVPPFWRTYWFISLLVLATGGSTFYVIRYQREKTRRQKEELKAIIDGQTSEVKRQNAEIVAKNEQEKVQNWIVQGLAYFGDIISKHKGSLQDLSEAILSNLIKYVSAQQGCMAIAMNDDDETYLKITSTYATNKERTKSDRIEIGQGLIGATFADREKKYLTNVPINYIKVESGLGGTQNVRLVILPLKTDTDIYGVIELAFITDVNEVTHEFLDKLASIIALNINAATLNDKTQMLLQQSKEQTEELRAQEEEMRQNMEELEATQEEQRRREIELQQKLMEIEAIQKESRKK